jgi:ABC-type polysaccharide/polyol phosphate export permease
VARGAPLATVVVHSPPMHDVVRTRAPWAAAWAYRDLVRHLVGRDLRHKYKGSTFGFAWSLANPLLMAAIYTLAFAYIVRVPVARFPLYLLSGLLPWTFFAGGLLAATSSIVDGGALVRKVAFPRLVLPVAAVATQFVQFVLTFAVVVPLAALWTGDGTSGISPSMVAVVPALLLQLAFTVGLGLLLAAAYVHARDTRHLVEVAVQLWFWLTPIVYAEAMIPRRLASLVWLNPMAHFTAIYHAACLDGTWGAPRHWIAAAAAAAVALAAGSLVFARQAPRFAEKL